MALNKIIHLREAQLLLGWGWPYLLSLTLKFIQGRWFLCHLKGRMPLPVSN